MVGGAYAKPRGWQWKYRDILRRKNIALSEDDVKLPVPYARRVYLFVCLQRRAPPS